MLFLLWVVAWGWACAILAHNKGRGWFGWFIAGAMFWLLALLVVLFLDKREPAVLQRSRLGARGRRGGPPRAILAMPVT